MKGLGPWCVNYKDNIPPYTAKCKRKAQQFKLNNIKPDLKPLDQSSITTEMQLIIYTA